MHYLYLYLTRLVTWLGLHQLYHELNGFNLDSITFYARNTHTKSLIKAIERNNYLPCWHILPMVNKNAEEYRSNLSLMCSAIKTQANTNTAVKMSTMVKYHVAFANGLRK